jgi:hypothetical protein
MLGLRLVAIRLVVQAEIHAEVHAGRLTEPAGDRSQAGAPCFSLAGLSPGVLGLGQTRGWKSIG